MARALQLRGLALKHTYPPESTASWGPWRPSTPGAPRAAHQAGGGWVWLPLAQHRLHTHLWAGPWLSRPTGALLHTHPYAQGLSRVSPPPTFPPTGWHPPVSSPFLQALQPRGLHAAALQGRCSPGSMVPRHPLSPAATPWCGPQPFLPLVTQRSHLCPGPHGSESQHRCDASWEGQGLSEGPELCQGTAPGPEGLGEDGA